MIKAALIDLLSGRSARVGVDGDLLTRTLALPQPGQKAKARPMAELLVDAAGSSDMAVDGSVTPVDFNIRAVGDSDRYVKTVIFTIADPGATLGEFGSIGVLANGVQFEWNLLGETVLIEPALQTNFDFLRLAGGQPAFGDDLTAFRARDIVGIAEGFMAVLDMNRQFGFAYGLRLGPRSDERLTIRVRDNLSTVSAFNAKAYGFDLAIDS